MKILKLKKLYITTLCTLAFTGISYSQEGTLTINQDEKIDKLLAVKKKMNTSEETSDRYRIQIYSGDRSGAEKMRSKIGGVAAKWPSKLVYETPNYKVWIGNFRSRLEADRALKQIQKTFNSAFIFKPKTK